MGDSGFITYFQGRGRGNRSTVKFNIDIEDIIVKSYVKNIDKYSIEDINEVLNLPISNSTKQFIKASLETRLFSKQFSNGENGEKLVDYYPKLPSMQDLLDGTVECNFSFMTLVLNVTNRLYETNDEGKIINGIVRYDEWQNNTFIIYLRKDVLFFNGENICANMIVENLERILEQEYMKQFKKYILSINVLDSFKLAITMTGRYEVIRYVLTRLEASIFLRRKQKLYTTGAYYIEQHDDDTIHLQQNPYYFGEKSDIARIEMTNNPTKYSHYIQENSLVNVPLRNNTIMTYAVLNSSSEVFNLSERCQLRNLISQFLNTQGDAHDYQLYPYKYDTILNFERPLKVAIKDDLPVTSQFVEYLNNSGIPAISIPLDETNHNEDIYLGRVTTEKQFFFNLLVFEPIDEWFEDSPEGKRLIEAYKHDSATQ